MNQVNAQSKINMPWWLSALILTTSLTILLYTARLCGRSTKANAAIERIAAD